MGLKQVGSLNMLYLIACRTRDCVENGYEASLTSGDIDSLTG